jgi:RNA polymerase sigma-70 factor, ECF subfamily
MGALRLVASHPLSNVVPFPTVVRDDEELIERLRKADPEVVALLYRRHHQKVRAFARRMLNDHAAAEDVVHDAFVALPKAAERFRMEARIDTFLLSIAVNLCRRQLRSSARGRRAVENLERREPPAAIATPETAASRRELAAALERGLEELSTDHREVFVLCAVEERTSQEVGQILEIAEGTVRTRLFHARKQLRAFFEREGLR